MATVSVCYIVDVEAAIGLYTKLTELASVRHLGFMVDPAAGAITTGRARALLAAVAGLISLVIGGLALARSRRSRSTH